MPTFSLGTCWEGAPDRKSGAFPTNHDETKTCLAKQDLRRRGRKMSEQKPLGVRKKKFMDERSNQERAVKGE
jgi:hypothetical protein